MPETMPEIAGSDIDEEYADALAAIRALRAALEGRPLTNDTPDGRLLLSLAWVEQEIRARRLPIPLDRSYAGTIYYLTGSGELNGIRGVKQPLGDLYTVLQGVGLVKERHRPALIAMIADLLADASRCGTLSAVETAALSEFAMIKRVLEKGSWPAERDPADYPFSGMDTDNLDACIPDFFERYTEIEDAVFERSRPEVLRKPPLPAPVPGLAPMASPLPAQLADDLP